MTDEQKAFLAQQIEQLWNKQQAFSTARAVLRDKTGGFADALAAFGDALAEVIKTGKATAAAVVEFPMEHPERALAEQECKVWIDAATAVQTAFEEVCNLATEATLALDQADGLARGDRHARREAAEAKVIAHIVARKMDDEDICFWIGAAVGVEVSPDAVEKLDGLTLEQLERLAAEAAL